MKLIIRKSVYCLIVIMAIIIFISMVYGKFNNENQGSSKVKVFISINESYEGDRKIGLMSLFIAREKDPRKKIKTLLEDDKIKYEFDNGYVAFVDKNDLEKINSTSAVKSVSTPRVFHKSLSESLDIINATIAHALRINNDNLTGKGQTICIIDSGINFSHSDLGGCYGNNDPLSSCKVIGGIDLCADNTDCMTIDGIPEDVDGHGTHVAGIAAANGSANGVAPDAKIIMIKASNMTGDFADYDVKTAIDWCVNNASIFNISVISMSLGGGSYTDYCDDDWDGDGNPGYDLVNVTGSIDNAVKNNISVIVATGNSASTSYITAPACITNATPISASNKDDTIAGSYANRNSLVQLLAPGTNILSTYEDVYAYLNGTSMSTPHVSGAIAVINQYLEAIGQSRNPGQIESILNSTGKSIYDSSSDLYFSRIDVYNALLRLDNLSVELVSPSDNLVTSSNQTYICNTTSNSELRNVSFLVWNNSDLLYNETRDISGLENSSVFSYNFSSEGNYSWNCMVENVVNISKLYTSNYSLYYDITNPSVSLSYPGNDSYVNEEQTFRCNASDYSLKNASIIVWNSSSIYNQTFFNISGINAQIEINLSNLENDNYEWNCFFSDEVGNYNSSSSNYSLRKRPLQLILIIVEGMQLNRYNTLLVSGQLTNFSKINDENGKSTSARITGHTLTESLPGNSEILTGLNESITNIYNNSNGPIPSGNASYERLKSYNSSIKTGFIYGKNISYMPNNLLENALSSIDWYHNISTFNNSLWPDDNICAYAENVSNKAREFISNYSNESFFLTVYYGNLDCSGHLAGDNSSNYTNALLNIDNGLGILLNTLEDYSLTGENNITKIIISSDNGWNSNTSYHNVSNSDTLNIPLISNDASLINNRTSDSLKEQCEISPTILDYFGIQRENYSDIINNGCDSMKGESVIPEMTINSPLNQTYTSSSVSFNTSLNELGLCNLTLDSGISNTSLSTNDNITFYTSLSLSDDSYIARFDCWDNYDNYNSSSVTFLVSTPSNDANDGSSGSSSSTSTSAGGGAIEDNNILLQTFSLTEEELSFGKTFELNKGDKIDLKIETEEHTLTIENINDNSVEIIIQSEPISVVLVVGQSIKLNLTSQDYYDIYIKLESITNGKVNLTLRKINEAIEKEKEEIEDEDKKMINDSSYEKNESIKDNDNKLIAPVLIVFFIIFVILLLFVFYYISVVNAKKAKHHSREHHGHHSHSSHSRHA